MLRNTMELTDEQRRAVRIALTERFAMVTGGPGTGKTTTMRRLATELRAQGRTFCLLAPTGKAASRLAEQTGEPASTIHRAIGWTPAGDPLYNRSQPLPFDTIIADESSMIDAWLMSRLLDAVGPSASLVLVGDDAQLPPVGPGAPFRDLLACAKIPAARLTAVFRQGAGSPVAEAARAVLAGSAPGNVARESGAFAWITCDEESILSRTARLVTLVLPQRFGVTTDAIQTLCPGREGPLSVQTLNETLGPLLNRAPSNGARLRAGDRAIVTKNDYELGVFNGETGTVLRATLDSVSLRIADRTVILTGRERIATVLPAWALTVHRSQGSEYKVIVLALSGRHHRLLTRRLVYTGITRAAHACIVLSTARTQELVLSNRAEETRETSLRARLSAMGLT